MGPEPFSLQSTEFVTIHFLDEPLARGGLAARKCFYKALCSFGGGKRDLRGRSPRGLRFCLVVIFTVLWNFLYGPSAIFSAKHPLCDYSLFG